MLTEHPNQGAADATVQQFLGDQAARRGDTDTAISFYEKSLELAPRSSAQMLTLAEALWQRSLRSGQPIGLAMIDVDNFKKYNDHYGAVADLQEPHAAADPGFVTISAGVASFHASTATTPAELIKTADEALYEAKRSGRNRANAG